MSGPADESDVLDYRHVSDADLNDFRRLLSYAFRPTEAFEPIESIDDIPDGATVADYRGLYADDELATTIEHYWFTLRIRGEWHSVAGVAGVSTPPKHRRNGYVRESLSASLREYRERDVDFAALWPFEYPFYRKFGWGTCSDGVVSRCSPDALSFVDSVEPSSGEFVDLTADRWDELAQVYEAYNDHGLAMQRTEEWWRKRVFQGRKKDPYVAGWERDGELRGYLVYTINEGDDGREMIVPDLAFCDHEAYIELVRFCRYHDSQVREVVVYAADTILHDLVDDPRAVEIEIQPGAMIRMVDVERALSALSYSTDESLSIVFAVEDGLVEWNDG